MAGPEYMKHVYKQFDNGGLATGLLQFFVSPARPLKFMIEVAIGECAS